MSRVRCTSWTRVVVHCKVKSCSKQEMYCVKYAPAANIIADSCNRPVLYSVHFSSIPSIDHMLPFSIIRCAIYSVVSPLSKKVSSFPIPIIHILKQYFINLSIYYSNTCFAHTPWTKYVIVAQCSVHSIDHCASTAIDNGCHTVCTQYAFWQCSLFSRLCEHSILSVSSPLFVNVV